VSASGLVSAPRERAWELLCDTRRYAEWVQGTDAVTRSTGAAAEGVTYDEVNPMLGPWKARTTWEVVEHEPPRRSRHVTHDLPLTSSFEVVMELSPEGDDACMLTITLRGEPAKGPLGAAFLRAMRASAAKDNERTVAAFAALVAREAG
jgi:carbon monoxide dehydrogenase subunit G